MGIKVSQVTLYVQDQDAAVDFWTNKAGYAVTTDMPYGPGTRWIEVTSADGGARLVLYKADPGGPERSSDKPGYVMFDAADIVKAHEELAARGVRFTQAPVKEEWGWSAVFTDNEGNIFHLSQS